MKPSDYIINYGMVSAVFVTIGGCICGILGAGLGLEVMGICFGFMYVALILALQRWGETEDEKYKEKQEEEKEEKERWS